MRSRAIDVPHCMPIPQMWSGLPRYVPLGAHDWGYMLTLQGKSGSAFRAFIKASAGLLVNDLPSEQVLTPHARSPTLLVSSTPIGQSPKPREMRWRSARQVSIHESRERLMFATSRLKRVHFAMGVGATAAWC